jgi:hypothetical protein
MIAGVLAALQLLGPTTRLIMIGGLVLSLATAGGVIYYKIWQRGYDHAIADIAKQDKRAIAKASAARDAVLDCDARGLLWDQSTGQCSGR